jgi:ABC-2 type transport system permease protein
VPLVVLLGVSVGVVAPATGATGSGIEQDKVQQSVATAFAYLYRLQTKQLNRPDVTEAQLKATAACTKGGDQVVAEGAGNDWRCVVTWHLLTSRPRGRPSTSSTSPLTGGTPPTATDRRK